VHRSSALLARSQVVIRRRRVTHRYRPIRRPFQPELSMSIRHRTLPFGMQLELLLELGTRRTMRTGLIRSASRPRDSMRTIRRVQRWKPSRSSMRGTRRRPRLTDFETGIKMMFGTRG
jgi:hypothetical protein